MGYPEPAGGLLPEVGDEAAEVRYLVPKLCRLCMLTKPIPEQDDVCADCWALRMAGQAVVRCPYYLFEEPGVFEGGRAPIELCYSCAWRAGWTEELGPICNHPIAVNIADRWGVEVVLCPMESTLAGEGRWVPMETCTGCQWHRGELTIEAERLVYCGIPYEMTVGKVPTDGQTRTDASAEDEPQASPTEVPIWSGIEGGP
jgi:hypothetical protein